jgi:hypothetical protein
MKLGTRIAAFTLTTAAALAGAVALAPAAATAATNCNWQTTGTGVNGGWVKVWCETGTYRVTALCIDNNGNGYYTGSGWVSAPAVAKAKCSEDAYLSSWSFRAG